jgi:DNA repair exonuclease SbcCD nuclease subunit
MDYFALGDYHEARNLGKEFNEHIWYCGSTERMGFGEIYNDPQVLLVNIEEQTKNVSVQSLLLNVRDMIELEEIDAANKPIEEINELIEKKIESCDLKDKIVRLRVRNLPTHLKKFINDEKIKELTEDALYFKFELKDKVNQTKGIQTSGTNFEGVLEGWNAFIDALESDASYDKAKLKSIGYNRLSDALEKVE